MKLDQLAKTLRSGNKAVINTTIQNRKEVNQSQLRFLKKMGVEGVEITEDNMGQATWYYVSVNGENMGSQFYWNDGEYDAEGNHSLYDEYGFEVNN